MLFCSNGTVLLAAFLPLLTNPLVGDGTGASGAVQPNIIFILADDIGMETMRAYGGSSYDTPNLDLLAASGMRFDRAYAQPLCTPTRSKVLTGRSNARNYVTSTYLNPTETVFPQLFQSAGYATCGAGKWQLHGGPGLNQLAFQGLHPTQAGFDEWCLWFVSDIGGRYWDPTIETHNSPPTVLTGQYGPDVFNQFVLDFIDRNATHPFLIYYPMALAHAPFDPPPGYQGSGTSANDIFPAMMTYMDAMVGKVMARLRSHGIEKNTLLIFCTDNGTNGGIRSDFLNYPSVPGTKGLTLEPGLRMPVLASMKGTIPARTVCSDLIDYADFFPTLLDAANLDSEELDLDGRSFLPQLRGLPGFSRDWIYQYYWPIPIPSDPSQEVRWLVTKQWKLYADGRFFHILWDPLETKDLQNSTLPKVLAARIQCQIILDAQPARSPGIGG